MIALLAVLDHPVRRWIPVLLWMGGIFAVSARSTLPQPPGVGPDITSIAGHLFVYAILAALLHWALLDRECTPGRPRARHTLLVLGVAIVYGIADEWHQSFVPGRDATVFDVVTDAIGAAIGLAIALRVRPHPPRYAAARAAARARSRS